MRHGIYLNINGFEYEASVEYSYFKGSPGSREKGTGAPLEPDEPASVEVSGVLIKDDSGWNKIYLPAEVVKEIEEEILNEY